MPADRHSFKPFPAHDTDSVKRQFDAASCKELPMMSRKRRQPYLQIGGRRIVCLITLRTFSKVPPTNHMPREARLSVATRASESVQRRVPTAYTDAIPLLTGPFS